MFHARGKNIYDSGTSIRQIYSVKATVVPGNSGGPIVLANGEVVGVIFAQSTTYPNVGYALTAAAARQALQAVGQAQTTVSTGSCLSH
jgi:S1-C subfamily serine protease